MDTHSVLADLRTAQNRMFDFVVDELHRDQDRIDHLMESADQVTELFKIVRTQLFDLLQILPDSGYHMAITDSGKRTIENLVTMLCPPENGRNFVVPTENYVAFNPFSAAQNLEKFKTVNAEKIGSIEMGQILTGDNSPSMEEFEELLSRDKPATIWIASNSTSTGVRERVDKLVELRNRLTSSALVICDCASLPLFSNSWPSSNLLPDAFFFSLRKQGLPYEGPQDESNQARNSGGLLIYNDRALQQAERVGASPLHDQPRLAESAAAMITKGEQRRNHISHLVKLEIGLKKFLEKERKLLRDQDRERDEVRDCILDAFSKYGPIGKRGFSLLAEPSYQSTSSYIVKTPETISPKSLIEQLKEAGILVSPSMHPLVPGKEYFRFAFYPGNSKEEIDTLLDTVEKIAG